MIETTETVYILLAYIVLMSVAVGFCSTSRQVPELSEDPPTPLVSNHDSE